MNYSSPYRRRSPLRRYSGGSVPLGHAAVSVASGDEDYRLLLAEINEYREFHVSNC